MSTTVDNSATSTTDTGNNKPQSPCYCGDTYDKVFLLSEQEVTTSTYGFAAYNEPAASRIRMTTDYSKASGANLSSEEGRGSMWWLRSPHHYSHGHDQRGVYGSGDADSNYGVTNSRIGVVPALCID